VDSATPKTGSIRFRTHVAPWILTDISSARDQRVSRRAGRENVFKRATEHDRNAELPLETLRELGEHGLIALTISPDLGGMGNRTKGSDPLLYVLAVDQVARYDTSTAQRIYIHRHGSHYIDQ
jgi:alkylation response protein AidB-like acyl-CoA dehydrogenase